MNWKECEAEKLIKLDSRARNRIPVSLSTAERFLHSAGNNLEIDEYEIVELAAYNSAFRSARALLFPKGYIERSRTCLSIALKYLYKEDTLELIKNRGALKVDYNSDCIPFVFDSKYNYWILGKISKEN
jgi:uncharacterized protein (UPF0332 family)